MNSSTSPVPAARQGESEEHLQQPQPQQSTTKTAHWVESCMRDEQSASLSHPPIQRSTPSPPAVFTDNLPMQTALDQILLMDHHYDSQEQDENYLSDNINYATLLSRIRARNCGQIQYRVPKRRKQDKTKKRKSGDDMEVDDSSEMSDEIVIVTRQKRVKRAPILPRKRVDRDSSYDKPLRESAREDSQITASRPLGLPET